MSTKLKLLLEGQNQASAEVKQLTKDVAALGQTAATANQQLAGGSGAAGAKPADAAKKNAEQLAKVGDAASAANQAVSSLRATALVLGSQAFPQATNAILATTAAMEAARSTAKLTGLSFTAVLTGIAPLALAAAAAVTAIGVAWYETAKKQTEAIEAQEAATKRLTESRESLRKKLDQELSILKESGAITQRQADDVLYGKGVDPIAKVYTETAGGHRFGEVERSPVDLHAAVLRLDALRKEINREPITLFDKTQATLAAALQDGLKKDVALAEAQYKADLLDNAELRRRNQISAEQLKILDDLAQQKRDHTLADIAFQDAQEKAARIKRGEEEKQANKKSIAERIAADREAQRQVTAIQRQVGDNADNRIIADPHSGPGVVAEAQKRIEERQYEDHLDYLDKLNLSDEQYWTAAQELAKDHSAKILEIERKKAESEKQLNQQRLAATGEFLGNSAQLAKQFGREGFIAYKAFAIGQAVINTALAISNESSQGDIYSKVFRMAAIGALGAAQVAAIVAEAPPYARGGIIPGQYNGQDDRVIQVGPGEVVLNPRQAQMVGMDRIFGALEATGGRLPWNFTPPAPGKIVGFAGGGVASVAAPSGPIDIKVGLIADRQDEHEWLLMKERKVMMQNLHRWGVRR